MLLKDKIKKAHRVIKKAAERWKPKQIAVAWTGGKDSTVLLHLIKETFHHLRGGKPDSSEVKKGKPRRLNQSGYIPFRVMFNDSTLEFPEIYDFVKRLKKDWRLDLLWIKHLPEDLKAYRNLIGHKAEEPPRLRSPMRRRTGKPWRLKLWTARRKNMRG